MNERDRWKERVSGIESERLNGKEVGNERVIQGERKSEL